MKYILKDIELWNYNGMFPPKLLNNKLTSQYIGKQYTIKEFKSLIHNLYQKLYSEGWYIHSTMNPLYPDKGYTVISIDLSKNIITNTIKKESMRKSNIDSLDFNIEKHLKLSNKLFEKANANISYKKLNNILYSQNAQLYALEKKNTKINNKIL